MTRHHILTIVLLIGCEGCGSGDSAQSPQAPQEPVPSTSLPPASLPTRTATPTINAGGDQIVRLGDTVTLSGSSTTTEAHPSYLWQFVSMPTGSNVVLADPTKLTLSFTPDLVGLYVISLTLNAGPSDELIVEVSR